MGLLALGSIKPCHCQAGLRTASISGALSSSTGGGGGQGFGGWGSGGGGGSGDGFAGASSIQTLGSETSAPLTEDVIILDVGVRILCNLIYLLYKIN